jgi:hypothetical protein
LTSITVDSSNSNYKSIDGVLFNNTETILLEYPLANTRATYTIPASVTSIGDYAFYGASKLTSITIPEGVTSIGDYAFALTHITSIVFTLYATVKLLGLNIGSGQTCYGLTNVTILALDAILFSDSGKLTEAIVSAQLTTQTNVLISGYTSIGANAFYNTNIESISIPSSVTSIGQYAFAYTNITSISIPSSITSIDEYAFAFTYITSISIPSSVTSIGQYAFSNSTLTTISIPASVTSIDQYAFSNSAIASIHVALSNNYYGSDINGVLFDVTGTILIQYPSGKTQSSYIIPDGVTTIGQYAFQYSNLSQIVIPASVTSIGNYAFFNNISLTTIVFENNSNLTNIGNYAFASSPSTSSLTSINIPASVQTIGDYAFQYSNLSTIVFDGNSVLTNIGNFSFSYSKISEIIIPPSVQTIGNNAFYLCPLLKNVQIDLSSNLSSIGDNAFAGTHITSINIPASVQKIGNHTFNYIRNLKVYIQSINKLNLTEQTDPNFYGAPNAQIILYRSPVPSEPPSQPPAPTPTAPAQQSAQYQSNGSGPIQICTSRLANCKITKTNFQNGYVMNNRATAMQRMSTLISVQSQMRNATWTQIYAPTNAYSQRTGGPVGYGQSPRNTF